MLFRKACQRYKDSNNSKFRLRLNLHKKGDQWTGTDSSETHPPRCKAACLWGGKGRLCPSGLLRPDWAAETSTFLPVPQAEEPQIQVPAALAAPAPGENPVPGLQVVVFPSRPHSAEGTKRCPFLEWQSSHHEGSPLGTSLPPKGPVFKHRRGGD